MLKYITGKQMIFCLYFILKLVSSYCIPCIFYSLQMFLSLTFMFCASIKLKTKTKQKMCPPLSLSGNFIHRNKSRYTQTFCEIRFICNMFIKPWISSLDRFYYILSLLLTIASFFSIFFLPFNHFKYEDNCLHKHTKKTFQSV